MIQIRKPLWLLGLIIACLVASCVGAAPTPAPAPLRVEWTFWQGDYTLVIAQKMGFFEKYGVDVELVRYDTASSSIPDLAGAKLDGGIYTMSDIILASSVADIQGVMVTDNGGIFSIVSSPAVNSLADLSGKRIGLSLHTTIETYISHALGTVNLTTNDVSFVDMDPQQVIEAIPNRIDAGIVWEPYTTQAVERGEKILYQSTSYSSFNTKLVTFRKDVLQKRPSDIRAFLKAWDEAITFRIHDPSESLAILAVATGLPATSLNLTKDITLYNTQDNTDLFRDTSGTQNTSIYYIALYNRDYLINLGYITTSPDINALLDSSFLK